MEVQEPNELATLAADEQALLKAYRQLSPTDKQFALGLFVRLSARAPAMNESYGAVFNCGEITHVGHVFNLSANGESDK